MGKYGSVYADVSDKKCFGFYNPKDVACYKCSGGSDCESYTSFHSCMYAGGSEAYRRKFEKLFRE